MDALRNGYSILSFWSPCFEGLIFQWHFWLIFQLSSLAPYPHPKISRTSKPKQSESCQEHGSTSGEQKHRIPMMVQQKPGKNHPQWNVLVPLIILNRWDR